MLYFYILIFILLAVGLYILVSSKLKKNHISDTELKDPSDIHDEEKETTKENETVSKHTEDESLNLLPKDKEETKISVSQKPKTPYTSTDPFKETENIHNTDFIIFQGATILLVEDNFINQKIIISTLSKSGIDISVANDGKEAVNIIFSKEKEFDLVLMDISMPVMDGYDSTKIIRDNHEFDSLPIVTFTAFTSGIEIQKMFDLGANSFITKPLNIKQLYTVFNTYLIDNYRVISLAESIKIDGLDIKHGITMSNNDELAYKQSLREFVLLYKSMITTMPQWIHDKESDRILATCINMGDFLKYIGAYELQEIVFRMKKFYVYNTDHRIEEFHDIFPKKLQKLINAIERYIKA